jgi:ATP-dependent RNA helicase SUPV3L1/SUV3
LRKYGVRFGAYHIYVPSLLKPAARALASLLWALKQDNVELSTLSGAQHLASSGRTSFPIDKTLPRDAYRVLGYRQCGERAVRVDILERLADLIRPALAWRETSPGEKPAGAFDGRSFVVTQAMTSLTGSAGEDFASILRALGYRMDRRPPLPPKPAVVEAAPANEATPSETPSEVAAEPAVETAASETHPEISTDSTVPTAGQVEESAPVAEQAVVSSTTLLPQVDFAQRPDVTEAASDSAIVSSEATPETVEAEAPSAATEAVAEQGSTEASAETAGPSDAAPVEAAATSSEPELVEVWRPGGRSDERRPQRHDRHRNRRPERAAEGGQPAAAGEAASGEAGEGAKREHHRRRDRHRDFRKPRPDQPAQGAAPTAEGAPAPEAREGRREDRREDRNGRPRFDGKGRDERNRSKSREDGGRDKGRDRGGRDRDRGGRESGPSHRQYASSAGPRDRDRPIDPNSPFAKLAALKEQMSAPRKE